jgi:hypothetical protein
MGPYAGASPYTIVNSDVQLSSPTASYISEIKFFSTAFYSCMLLVHIFTFKFLTIVKHDSHHGLFVSCGEDSRFLFTEALFFLNAFHSFKKRLRISIRFATPNPGGQISEA